MVQRKNRTAGSCKREGLGRVGGTRPAERPLRPCQHNQLPKGQISLTEALLTDIFIQKFEKNKKNKVDAQMYEYLISLFYWFCLRCLYILAVSFSCH